MLIHLPNIFDEKKCKELAKLTMDYHHHGKLSSEAHDRHYKNSFGKCLKEFDAFFPVLTPIIKEKTGYQNIKIQNSYTRIYFNDSILKKHVDRNGLDLTLSVCLFDNTGKDWPLYVEHDGKVVPVITKVGEGGLILGTKMNHWRDLLICKPDQMVIQCFFHWQII